MARYAAHMFPWIIFALVAVPLVVVGFVASRRRTRAGEHPAGEDAQATALTEQEFAEAEAYEAKLPRGALALVRVVCARCMDDGVAEVW